jgi:hypothetical protein
MGLAPLLVCKTRVTVIKSDGKLFQSFHERYITEPWWVRFPLPFSI